jgi:hypothetical protein
MHVLSGADILQYLDRPLHVAARNNHLSIVKLLVKAGAQTNLLDKNSYTALRWAVNKGYIEIIRTLIKFGADINTRDRYLRTPLHGAAMQGHASVLKLLIEVYGADFTMKDKWGDTVLHKACQKGHINSIGYLLKFPEMPVNALNRRKHTALAEASAGHELFDNPAKVMAIKIELDIDEEGEISELSISSEDESLPDSQLNYHDINIDVAPDSALATASATEEAEEVIDSAGNFEVEVETSHERSRRRCCNLL